jgi:exodeoxyribonuclease VII small subunit
VPNARRNDAPQEPNADVAALGYEQARDELVAVVARLEAGVGSLEESLALWERGEALAARCQQWLDGARERLAAAQPPGTTTGTPGTTEGDDEAGRDGAPAQDEEDE